MASAFPGTGIGEPGRGTAGMDDPGIGDPGGDVHGRTESAIGDPGRAEPAIHDLSRDAPGIDDPGGDVHGRAESAIGDPGRAEPAIHDLSRDAPGMNAPGRDARAGVDGQSKDDRVEEAATRVADTFGQDDYKENLYKGILWMKDKYEQYREMADQRYERLKDQLTKVERRYEDLLSSLGGARPVVGVKPAEETPPAEPAGMEAVTMAERIGMEPIIVVEPDRPMVEPDRPMAEPMRSVGPAPAHPEEPRAEKEPRAEIVEITPVDREERTHTQELEEQLARTRQRLEEELGRVRYQLEDEIARSRRQQDEQAAVVETNRHLEQQVVYSNRQLEEKQRIIADLEGQLRADRQKIDELVIKLRNNGQLLMKIYQELDKSLHFNDIPKEP